MLYYYNVILYSNTEAVVNCRIDGICIDTKNADVAIACAKLMMAQPQHWQVFNVEFMGIK